MRSIADEFKNIGDIDNGMLERINLYEDQFVLQKENRQRNIPIKNLRTAMTGIFILTAAILLILVIKPKLDENSSSGTGIAREESEEIIPRDSVLHPGTCIYKGQRGLCPLSIWKGGITRRCS